MDICGVSEEVEREEEKPVPNNLEDKDRESFLYSITKVRVDQRRGALHLFRGCFKVEGTVGGGWSHMQLETANE